MKHPIIFDESKNSVIKNALNNIKKENEKEIIEDIDKSSIYPIKMKRFNLFGNKNKQS